MITAEAQLTSFLSLILPEKLPNPIQLSTNTYLPFTLMIRSIFPVKRMRTMRTKRKKRTKRTKRMNRMNRKMKRAKMVILMVMLLIHFLTTMTLLFPIMMMVMLLLIIISLKIIMLLMAVLICKSMILPFYPFFLSLIVYHLYIRIVKPFFLLTLYKQYALLQVSCIHLN
ncbi:hypothetical protein EDC94DRAFT_591380, partial [Helicostylum pulchrum]